ncbi:MAG: DUF134 domain-containing protein [Thermoplasmatota archaeon]
MEKEAFAGRRGRFRNQRWIGVTPNLITLKPRGTPMSSLEVLEIRVEEMEAMRLVDLEGHDLTEASKMMGVSRRTLTRDLKEGRRKTAEALVMSKAVVVRGGDYEIRKVEDKE